MKLLRELADVNEEIDAINITEMLEESVRTMKLASKGGLIKGAKDWISKNPALSIGAAAMALHAHSNYEKNKRNTIRLHGKTAYEKKMMTDIADTLTKQGAFKLHRTKFEGGGKTLILMRKFS